MTFNVTLLSEATNKNAVHGSKAVGEPPLMLAISVRRPCSHIPKVYARTVRSFSFLDRRFVPEAGMTTTGHVARLKTPWVVLPTSRS